MPVDTVMGRKRLPLRDRGSWYLCKKEGEIMKTCVCYFLELELLFCFFVFFFACSYNGLAPQLVSELIKAGAKVYIKREI